MKRVTRDEYENNDKTKVAVVNKQKKDGDRVVGYEPIVTITVKAPFSATPLEFRDADEIEKFISTIDVEDPQTRLDV